MAEIEQSASEDQKYCALHLSYLSCGDVIDSYLSMAVPKIYLWSSSCHISHWIHSLLVIRDGYLPIRLNMFPGHRKIGIPKVIPVNLHLASHS